MKLIEKSNDYIKTMDSWDIGLLKTCMFAFGVVLGVTIPKTYKTKTVVAAGAVYVATVVAVGAPYIKFLLDKDDSI